MVCALSVQKQEVKRIDNLLKFVNPFKKNQLN